MRYGIVLDEVFLAHAVPPGHPERPERIQALLDSLASLMNNPDVVLVDPKAADESAVLAVHSKDHLALVKATAGRGHFALDPDTHTGANSYESALLVAGSAVNLVELVGERKLDIGFVLGRPPGHHAERDKAMGFCLFNNAAIAAQAAINLGIAKRVAIVDFDVHHGNGTQNIFYGRSDVLYVSSHQHPFYPGTGLQEETGVGEGTGFTVNFPLKAGSGDYFYTRIYEDLVAPILVEFDPDLILVSGGFDAHKDDPLGGMEVSEEGFAYITHTLNKVALKTAGGRILYLLEGGYSLSGLSQSVLSSIQISLDGRQPKIDVTQESETEAYMNRARATFYRYWKSLGF
jgi:acetoin utilization deacetylase AcuC-like enzyme